MARNPNVVSRDDERRRRDRQRDGLARLSRGGIKPDQRLVGRGPDPDRTADKRDRGRRHPQRDRLRDGVGRDIDANYGAANGPSHPDRTAPNRYSPRLASKRYAINDLAR